MALRRLILTLTVVTCSALASPIATLHNTGTLTSGSGPVVDDAWKIEGGTAYVTSMAGFPFGTWFDNSTTSSWISPRPSYLNWEADAEDWFLFETNFDLTGLNPGTAWITVHWSADNTPWDVLLNGISLGHAFHSGTFAMFSPDVFTISGDFLPGENTLTFRIQNTSSSVPNPVGLRVEFESDATELSNVPEPSSFVLLASALLGLGAIRFRRQR